MHLVPRPKELAAAGRNVEAKLFRGGVADLRRQPAVIIDEGAQRTVLRYRRDDDPYRRRRPERGRNGGPILLVPPLAAPATCFDLRRGCSLVERLVTDDRPTYLVDYGPIAFADRRLGIEHWVSDVIPRAIRRVSADADDRAVHVVTWSLGGIMSALVAADQADLPLASLTVFGSPFDITKVPLVAPARPIVNLTRGQVGTILYRLLGGVPSTLTRTAFQATGLTSYLTKPITLAQNLDDTDFLAQIEAVDAFMGSMYAYPGRTFGQLYHRFLRGNELAGGTMELDGRRIDLANVTVPVLAIAGENDVIAPVPTVHHIGSLVPDATLTTAPGGHLGVLTGRRARGTSWAALEDFVDRADAAA